MTDASKELQEFADSVEYVSKKWPDKKRVALKAAAKELKKKIRHVIDDKRTDKGGTLYSATSPYSPGTTNQSARHGTGKYHVRDTQAWYTRLTGEETVEVGPKEDIYDRAVWLEWGNNQPTADDKPMFFFVNGSMIVVGKPQEDAGLGDEKVGPQPVAVGGSGLDRMFGREAGEIESSDSQHIFTLAQVRFARHEWNSKYSPDGVGTKLGHEMSNELDELVEEAF